METIALLLGRNANKGSGNRPAPEVIKHDSGQADILGSNPSLLLQRTGLARRKTSKELS